MHAYNPVLQPFISYQLLTSYSPTVKSEVEIMCHFPDSNHLI